MEGQCGNTLNVMTEYCVFFQVIILQFASGDETGQLDCFNYNNRNVSLTNIAMCEDKKFDTNHNIFFQTPFKHS